MNTGLISAAPDGLPIAYEVMRGNTSDKTTLRGMLEKITAQYGKQRRTWIMDRGIPTEAVLEEMRGADPAVSYLVGTPKGRLTKLEKTLAEKDWNQVKDDVSVKLLPQGDELYVLARSLRFAIRPEPPFWESNFLSRE